MEFECIQCPPITYLSHNVCHKLFYEFQDLCQQYELIKENVDPEVFSKLRLWKSILNDLFYLCSTDQQYQNYADRFKEFIKVFTQIVKEPIRHGPPHRQESEPLRPFN
jgi:hypothetical protein